MFRIMKRATNELENKEDEEIYSKRYYKKWCGDHRKVSHRLIILHRNNYTVHTCALINEKFPMKYYLNT